MYSFTGNQLQYNEKAFRIQGKIWYNAPICGGKDMNYTYKTHGTCSTAIHFDIEDGKLENVHFDNGCDGNLQGIGRLVEGMDVSECIKKLEGIRCDYKSTSCPDQLARALKSVSQN